MLTVPVRSPFTLGLNDTLMAQLFPIGSLAPQVVVSRKSPVTVMLETLSVAFPVLVNAMFLAEEVLPTISAPNFRAVGNKLTQGMLRYKEAVVWPV